jgi:hypothetical protein
MTAQSSLDHIEDVLFSRDLPQKTLDEWVELKRHLQTHESIDNLRANIERLEREAVERMVEVKNMAQALDEAEAKAEEYRELIDGSVRTLVIKALREAIIPS